MLAGEHVLGRSQALKLVAIVRAMPREQALALHGQENAYALARRAEAVGEPAAAIVERGGIDREARVGAAAEGRGALGEGAQGALRGPSRRSRRGRLGDPVERLTNPRTLLVLGAAPIRIAVLTAIEGVPSFAAAWKRRDDAPFGSQRVHFVSREDLLASKRAAGRLQDLVLVASATTTSPARRASPNRAPLRDANVFGAGRATLRGPGKISCGGLLGVGTRGALNRARLCMVRR